MKPELLDTETAHKKEQHLKTQLAAYERLAVAYSGGLDSSYLAEMAHQTLGPRAEMIIADSPSIPRSELNEAVELANLRGWNLRIIQTKEHHRPAYLANQGDRCFHCKTELFSQMQDIMKSTDSTVLAHGAIEDDKGDHRPGTKAAENHQVIAPLQNVGLYKVEVRILSKAHGLPTAEKASFACLGSRFPTGTPIQIDAMKQVEQAEEILKQRAYQQYRVRHHGDVCRIELDPTDFTRLIQERTEIIEAIQATGYRFVALDLCGYKTGSSA